MTTWYIARGAGLSALLLLSISTCIGALTSRRGGLSDARSIRRRYVVQYLHRVFAGLGVAALLLHIVAILADSYADVGWLGAIVPFTSGYRPQWVALGTLAAYTFIVVALLGLARGRMAASPRAARAWRGLHCLSYAGWAMAIWHGFTAGSDSSAAWVRVLYIACLAAVVGSATARLLQTGRPTTNAAPARDRFAGREGVRTLQEVSR